MKQVIIKRGGERLQITAPEGKAMAIDSNALSHGVLAIGEHGPSGIKIAAFSDWSEAIFDCEAAGYTLKEMDPF